MNWRQYGIVPWLIAITCIVIGVSVAPREQKRVRVAVTVPRPKILSWSISEVLRDGKRTGVYIMHLSLDQEGTLLVSGGGTVELLRARQEVNVALVKNGVQVPAKLPYKVDVKVMYPGVLDPQGAPGRIYHFGK